MYYKADYKTTFQDDSNEEIIILSHIVQKLWRINHFRTKFKRPAKKYYRRRDTKKGFKRPRWRVKSGEVSLVATAQCWDPGQIAGNIGSRVLRNKRDFMFSPENIPDIRPIELILPGYKGLQISSQLLHSRQWLRFSVDITWLQQYRSLHHILHYIQFKNRRYGSTWNGISFLTIFVGISQLVNDLKWGRTHSQIKRRTRMA
jgi:hypothetical protein